ncbi:MAG: hypothetical protein DRQ55_13745 [Planctomycetota bacterium]|nr:MAG: hypothetical protein DRQ55_13745 [Planctomycetota bacterium]
MGYESGPLIGFDPQQTSELLGLPEDHAPLLLVVVGKGTQPARQRLGLLDVEELASVDRFGQHTITGAVEGQGAGPASPPIQADRRCSVPAIH